MLWSSRNDRHSPGHVSWPTAHSLEGGGEGGGEGEIGQAQTGHEIRRGVTAAILRSRVYMRII